MHRTRAGKCGGCGETSDSTLTIAGLGTFCFGGCRRDRLAPDDARVVHEIEDENVIVHVQGGGLL